MNPHTVITDPPVTHRQPALSRAGHVLAALVQIGVLVAVNGWPGWWSVPFVTDSATQVVWLFNVSVSVGLVLSLAYVIDDTPVFKALGDTLTAGLGLAVFVRTWQVFPFSFASQAVDWALLLRVFLGVAIVATAIGFVVRGVSVITSAAAR